MLQVDGRTPMRHAFARRALTDHGRMTGVFTVIGDVLVDLVEVRGEAGRFVAHPGGSAYNVAITLARLGEDVALLARTGPDRFGRMLRAKARDAGVSFDRWQEVAEPTTLAIASLDPSGGAEYDFYLDATAGPGWDDTVVELADSVRVLHLGSLSSWLPRSGRVLHALQRRAYDAGALVSYDPNVRPALITDAAAVRGSIEESIAAAHLVKASDEDAAFLYRGEPLADVARRWCRLGASVVVFTRGATGAVAFGADGELARVPGHPVVVADTVGAGDSFAGGLLAALAADALIDPAELATATPERIRSALRRAVLVSAITCERPGADPPTRAEVDARRG
jgi:fructokinase